MIKKARGDSSVRLFQGSNELHFPQRWAEVSAAAVQVRSAHTGPQPGGRGASGSSPV